ncbi:hypothetical protein EP227_04390 [bacterium]|nr:MAG: hypothetical protein EP227_04390 [bacterium]
MRNTLISILTITIFYIPLVLIDYNHLPYSDGAEHGAAVRELANNVINPADPMLANHPGDSSRFVPSILLMALFMKWLHLDILAVLKIFLIVFFILFLIAAALFSREYFNDKGHVPWSLASLLFLWGSGWTGANAYMFSAILYTAYFPSVVSFSLSLLACFFQLRFLRYRRAGTFILYLILGALAFVNHPLTGAFFLISSGILYVEKRGFSKETFVYYALSLVVTFVLVSLWPYYSFFSNLLRVVTGEMAQTADYRITRHYLYSRFFIGSGPALAGIPFVILFFRQRRYAFLTGGFAVFSLCYLAGYFFKISLAERFIFFIIFTLQMAVSRILREWFRLPSQTPYHNSKRMTAWLLGIVLIAGLGIQLAFTYTKFISPAFERKAGSNLPRYVNPNALQVTLRNYLSEDDVVLSDRYTSWSIPLYTGAKVIALFHTPPHVTDNPERIKAVETFYNTATTPEARRKILTRYGVTHILLNFKTAGTELVPVLDKMGFSVITGDNSFRLYSAFSN